MLKRRLIANLVIKDNLIVQSFAFNRYLPIGKPRFTLEFLARWDVDEITIFDISASKENRLFNTDILEYISKHNKYRPRLVAGFSAETDNLTKNSINKIKRKHCDIIFANNVSQKNIGFNSDYNKVSVIDKKGNVKIIPKNKKSFIANKIAEILLDKLLIDDRNIN